jgi:photosystem II stability/assembly factor-like uncharacterized protein
MSGTTHLLVGTTKGAFILTANADRTNWAVSGPHCDGWPINHMTGDAVSGTIWAGGGGDWHGAGVWRSTDGGATWTLSRLSTGQMDQWAANDPDFAAMIGWVDAPAPFGDTLHSVWSLHHAHGKLHAGTKPAQLLTSTDGGETWQANTAFAGFPEREAWSPGAAGLTLHTLVSDPDAPEKFWLAVSAAGVFATEDGGETWDRRNRLSNAEACGHHEHPAAPRNGETGHCVHNMVRARTSHAGADTLYQQNHHGTWRSRDGGRTWDDIGQGLPSTFGFPIAVHPHDPDTIWVLPLNGDSEGRYPPAHLRRSGCRTMLGKRGPPSTRACPGRTATSRCSGRPWRPTGAGIPGSISEPTPGRYSPLSMGERHGTRSRATCPPCWGSRHSRRDSGTPSRIAPPRPIAHRHSARHGRSRRAGSPRSRPSSSWVSEISAACASALRCAALRVPGDGQDVIPLMQGPGHGDRRNRPATRTAPSPETPAMAALLAV